MLYTKQIVIGIAQGMHNTKETSGYDVSEDEVIKIQKAFRIILDDMNKDLASVPVEDLYEAMEPQGKLERFIYRK